MARFSHTECGPVTPEMPTASPQHMCASRHQRKRGVGAGSAVDLGQLLVGGPLVVVGLTSHEAAGRRSTNGLQPAK